MAVIMMVVGFDKEPPTDLDDILGYAGFDINTSGKNLWGKITQYEGHTDVKGVFIRIIKYLDENIHSDNLPFILVDAIPPAKLGDELFVKRRTQQVKDVTTEMVMRLKLTPFNTFESFEVPGMSALVFKDAAPALDEELRRGDRKAILDANKPKKD
jgi:hypothetical protein